MGRSTSRSATTQTTSNTQLGLGDIEGISLIGEGNVVSLVDGGVVEASRDVTFDALATVRSIFTTAVDGVDVVAESFNDALADQATANRQAIATLGEATRSDTAETLGTLTKVVGVVAVATAGVFIFRGRR